MNCLDSSYIVDFLDPDQDHHDEAVTWMEGHAEEDLAVSAVSAFEILRGTARDGEDTFDRAVGFLRTLSTLELDFEMAIAAGDLDGRLHTEGRPLGARDTLVATPAIQHGYTLVTRDRDFESIPGLSIDLYAEG